MHLALISGSHRRDAQTLKVARYVETTLCERHPEVKTWLYSLSENPLGLWDDGHGGAPDDIWDPISRKLKEAEGFVILTPEWSGMATPGLKNFLLNCNATEVGHKPALIVTVSAGRGGSYPVAELRMSSYKNNRLCYLPEHVLVQHVNNNLEAPDNADDLTKEDTLIRGRIAYAVDLLTVYARAFREIRTAGVIDHKTFKSGM